MLGFETILIILLQLCALPILIFCSKSQKKDTGKSAKNGKNGKMTLKKTKSKTGLATEEPNSNKGAEDKKEEDVKKDAQEAPAAEPEPVRKEIESETF
ncbi:hypothetical protein L5515_015884 [Caenorhabditis briggsae]|uniref:Uncharacterized protein n=1 Tax=Caenorhabditis briggsae TaxID=6238 RepID=A0AAE9JAI6_CAEBR|nr:hypothetical protein L5515_015884 [Caenorhabditis briggsae]